jgi:hypothetical protein
MECIPCCLPERQGTHPWPGTAMAAEETHRRAPRRKAKVSPGNRPPARLGGRCADEPWCGSGTNSSRSRAPSPLHQPHLEVWFPVFAVDEFREVVSLPVDHVPHPPVGLDDREGCVAPASGARAAAADQEYLAVPELPQASLSLSRHQAIPNAATAETPMSTCPTHTPGPGCTKRPRSAGRRDSLPLTSRTSRNRLIGHALPRGSEPSSVIRRVEGPAGAVAHSCELVV